MVRRDRYEVIGTILERAEGKSKKTHMFFTTRQSYTEFERFFKTITELGLIEHAGDGYRTTEKGSECLGLIRALGNLAGTEQINSLYKSSSF